MIFFINIIKLIKIQYPKFWLPNDEYEYEYNNLKISLLQFDLKFQYQFFKYSATSNFALLPKFLPSGIQPHIAISI